MVNDITQIWLISPPQGSLTCSLQHQYCILASFILIGQISILILSVFVDRLLSIFSIPPARGLCDQLFIELQNKEVEVVACFLSLARTKYLTPSIPLLDSCCPQSLVIDIISARYEGQEQVIVIPTVPRVCITFQFSLCFHIHYLIHPGNDRGKVGNALVTKSGDLHLGPDSTSHYQVYF